MSLSLGTVTVVAIVGCGAALPLLGTVAVLAVVWVWWRVEVGVVGGGIVGLWWQSQRWLCECRGPMIIVNKEKEKKENIWAAGTIMLCGRALQGACACNRIVVVCSMLLLVEAGQGDGDGSGGIVREN